jgi:hypothetical protein
MARIGVDHENMPDAGLPPKLREKRETASLSPRKCAYVWTNKYPIRHSCTLGRQNIAYFRKIQ